MRRSLLPLAFLLSLSFAPSAVAQTVEDGFAAHDAGDYEKAKSILLPLAEAGDPRAMNRIGLMHDFGKGFPKAPATACDWYEKAAELNYRNSQSNLGVCFDEGIGRPRDAEKAIYWLTKAAEQNYTDAQVVLIRLLHQRDPRKAREWGQQAANAGSVPGRLLMEDYGLEYSGPRPGRYQKYCFILMVWLIKKPWGFCDYPVNPSALPPSPP